MVFYTLGGSEKLYALEFENLGSKEKAQVLHRLVLEEQIDALRQILIKYPLYVNASHNGFSLLNRAVYLEHKEIVELLLSLGADINFKNSGTGRTVLYNSRDPKITQVLVNHPEVDLNARDHYELTPLMHRIDEYRHLTVENIHILLAAGADVNISGPSGLTALHNLFDSKHPHYVHASQSDRERLNTIILGILKDMIDHGANVNAQTKDGLTPLHFAAKMNHVPAIKLLIQSGAKIDAVDRDYLRTPAMFALDNGSLDAVKTLIILGTDLDIRNQRGHSLKIKLKVQALEDPRYQRILNLRQDSKDISAEFNKRKQDPGIYEYERHHSCTKFLTTRQRKKIRNKRYQIY